MSTTNFHSANNNGNLNSFLNSFFFCRDENGILVEIHFPIFFLQMNIGFGSIFIFFVTMKMGNWLKNSFLYIHLQRKIE